MQVISGKVRLVELNSLSNPPLVNLRSNWPTIITCCVQDLAVYQLYEKYEHHCTTVLCFSKSLSHLMCLTYTERGKCLFYYSTIPSPIPPPSAPISWSIPMPFLGTSIKLLALIRRSLITSLFPYAVTASSNILGCLFSVILKKTESDAYIDL